MAVTTACLLRTSCTLAPSLQLLWTPTPAPSWPIPALRCETIPRPLVMPVHYSLQSWEATLSLPPSALSPPALQPAATDKMPIHCRCRAGRSRCSCPPPSSWSRGQPCTRCCAATSRWTSTRSPTGPLPGSPGLGKRRREHSGGRIEQICRELRGDLQPPFPGCL